MGMIQKIITLFIFLPMLLLAQNRVYTNIYVDDDNEGQNTLKYYIGFDRDIQNNLQLNFAGGVRNYMMPGLENIYQDLRLGGNYTPIDNLAIKGNVSFLFNDEWNPIFYNGLITYRPIDLIYIEGYIEHESVGSALTNKEELISTFIGASADFIATDDWTFVAGLAYNNITDDTGIRWYQTYRVIYTMPFRWIFVDVKAKIMNGGEYSPYYFSPETFGEYHAGVGIGQELFSPQYFIRLYLGGGLQTIDSDNKGLFVGNLLFLADFTTYLSGELKFGLSNAVNEQYGGYLYNYGTFKLIYNF
jgi:hypothetical protein